MVPVIFNIFTPTIEHTPVKPMKDPQDKELTVKELARLMISDLGKMLEEGIMVIVSV